MITKIEIPTLPVIHAESNVEQSDHQCLRAVEIKVHVLSRDLGNVGLLISTIICRYPKSNLAEILDGRDFTVHHYSPLKRSFTVGILTITEED